MPSFVIKEYKIINNKQLLESVIPIQYQEKENNTAWSQIIVDPQSKDS